jgi:hypothetical protein
MYPVIIKGGDHHLGGEFQQITVGNDIFQGLILKAQACIKGSLLAPFHDFLCVLVD